MVFCSENPIFVKQKEFMKGIVMKKFYILLAAISLFTFVACDKDKDNTPSEGNTEHKKIKTLIEYAEDGVSLISRTEYEYDEAGRIVGYKNYSYDKLTSERFDYQYTGASVTYTYKYEDRDILSISKYKEIYTDEKFEKLKTQIQFDEDGDFERIRLEYEYNEKGIENGYKQYYNGNLMTERFDYQFNGRTITYITNDYFDGAISSTRKNKKVYTDITYEKIKTDIIYSPQGTEEAKTEYDYDELGRLISSKTYHDDELRNECVNFQYDDLTMTYTYNYYIEGSKVHTRNYTCIYYE